MQKVNKFSKEGIFKWIYVTMLSKYRSIKCCHLFIISVCFCVWVCEEGNRFVEECMWFQFNLTPKYFTVSSLKSIKIQAETLTRGPLVLYRSPECWGYWKSALIEEKKFKHSSWAGADNPLGPKFWCQQEGLITMVICCKFKKNLFNLWLYTHLFMIW